MLQRNGHSCVTIFAQLNNGIVFELFSQVSIVYYNISLNIFEFSIIRTKCIKPFYPYDFFHARMRNFFFENKNLCNLRILPTVVNSKNKHTHTHNINLDVCPPISELNSTLALIEFNQNNC